MAGDVYTMTGGVGSWLYMAPEVVRRCCSRDMYDQLIRLSRTPSFENNFCLLDQASGLQRHSASPREGMYCHRLAGTLQG